VRRCHNRQKRKFWAERTNGYYIRVLATDATPVAEDELRASLPEKSSCELLTDQKNDQGWVQLVLRHADGGEIALIERNPVSSGELGEEELAEFIEEIKGEKPASAVRWLEQYLPRVKVIYAFQILGGADGNKAWEAIRALQACIWTRRGGILQSDGEGFSNEDGYSILWQFSDEVTGPWNMAVLNEAEKWIGFEMELGNSEQRMAFFEGKVPRGVRIFS
jgi:hypothetical protein